MLPTKNLLSSSGIILAIAHLKIGEISMGTSMIFKKVTGPVVVSISIQPDNAPPENSIMHNILRDIFNPMLEKMGEMVNFLLCLLDNDQTDALAIVLADKTIEGIQGAMEDVTGYKADVQEGTTTALEVSQAERQFQLQTCADESLEPDEEPSTASSDNQPPDAFVATFKKLGLQW